MKKLVVLMTLIFLTGCGPEHPIAAETQLKIQQAVDEVLKRNMSEDFQIDYMRADEDVHPMIGKRSQTEPNIIHVYVSPKRKKTIKSHLIVASTNDVFSISALDLSLYQLWVDVFESDAKDDYERKIKMYLPNSFINLSISDDSKSYRTDVSGKFTLYSDFIKDNHSRFYPNITIFCDIKPNSLKTSIQNFYNALKYLESIDYSWGGMRINFYEKGKSIPETITISSDDYHGIMSPTDLEKFIK
ncbi:hypothetical protein B5M42_014790 [Paenibacillus athensensis]|uniref:hypothetical protein n=1 Tax=Paenibacillus athensensis TaxID=1967502 RepID=UPI00106F63CC|nr:hypothetical protein [Paenibacillus athensensis]MCD1260079.1 hypothetical protein [Paenibacillus athensensis]